MGNLFGLPHQETDMTECASAASTTAQHGPSTSNGGPHGPSTSKGGKGGKGGQQCQRVERLSTSSSSSLSSSDEEISDADELYKHAMVEAWVSDVALVMDLRLAADPWLIGEGSRAGSRAGSVYSWRGGVDGRPSAGVHEVRDGSRQVGARKTKFESSTHLGANHVKAIRENRVYVVNVKEGEGRNGDLSQNGSAGGRNNDVTRTRPPFIEEITEGEYRRRMAPEWRRSPNRRPDPPERTGTTPRILAKTEGGANAGQNTNTRVRSVCKTSKQYLEAPRRGTEQPLKTSTSCVDSTRCVSGLQFVGDEPGRLMNREDKPVGDCVPDCRAPPSRDRTMRSYEYRRDFRERKGDGVPGEGGECQRPSGCQHCSSKLPVLRC